MDHLKRLLRNTRLLKYFAMAIIIVGIELATFQFIYLLADNYYLATTLSFILGVILNWIGSRLLVFGVSQHHPAREFTLVLTASIGGLLLQLLVIYVAVSLLLVYPLLGKIASIIFSFFWNYWFRAAIIYKLN